MKLVSHWMDSEINKIVACDDKKVLLYSCQFLSVPFVIIRSNKQSRWLQTSTGWQRYWTGSAKKQKIKACSPKKKARSGGPEDTHRWTSKPQGDVNKIKGTTNSGTTNQKNCDMEVDFQSFKSASRRKKRKQVSRNRQTDNKEESLEKVTEEKRTQKKQENQKNYQNFAKGATVSRTQ